MKIKIIGNPHEVTWFQSYIGQEFEAEFFKSQLGETWYYIKELHNFLSATNVIVTFPIGDISPIDEEKQITKFHEKFWMIKRGKENNTHNPKKVYASKQQAIVDVKKLAYNNPDEYFYLLESNYFCVCHKPYPEIESMKEEDPSDKEMYTCYGCGARDRCEFAWDEYNTNGDCLAEK